MSGAGLSVYEYVVSVAVRFVRQHFPHALTLVKKG